MKKALIVGNGKSSVNPRASFLGEGRDIFRINNFFLEPLLLFGKKVKFLVFSGEPFLIFLIDFLIRKKIYEIDIICYKKLHKRFFIPKVKRSMITWNDHVKKYKCQNSVPGFDGANQIDNKEKCGKITSAPYLINCAIQMGYKNISIIGVDFYSEKSGKKYPVIMPNCLKKIRNFEAPFSSVKINKKKGNSYDQGHSIGVDLCYIESLVNRYKDVEFDIYVDEGGPYENWNKIVVSNPTNITIHMMEAYGVDNLLTHCLSDIEQAINEYKKKYFWGDKLMKARHLFANRKPVIKKSAFLLKEKLLGVIDQPKSE